MTVEQIQPLTFLSSSSSEHSAAHLGLVLVPGSFALGLAQLLVLFVVQQRVVLVKRHNMLLAGLQQLRQQEILRTDGDTLETLTAWVREVPCRAYLWHRQRVPVALAGGRRVQQVRLEHVEFGQLVEGEVPLNLLLVHHTVGQGLLGHLTVIDLLLHGALVVEIKGLY